MTADPTRDDGRSGPAHCYRHPNREAGVRCTRCDRPICPDCMRPASVGFHCPDDVGIGRRDTRAPRTSVGADACAQSPPVRDGGAHRRQRDRLPDHGVAVGRAGCTHAATARRRCSTHWQLVPQPGRTARGSTTGCSPRRSCTSACCTSRPTCSRWSSSGRRWSGCSAAGGSRRVYLLGALGGSGGGLRVRLGSRRRGRRVRARSSGCSRRAWCSCASSASTCSGWSASSC